MRQAFWSLQQRPPKRTERVNKPSTQIRRLLISGVVALLLSGFASLKNHAEVIREGRPADQTEHELPGSIGPNPDSRGLDRLAISQAAASVEGTGSSRG